MQAMFGAGCFWGVEDSFRKLNVKDVACGYSGGHKDNPTYEEVCKTDTGHAEVVLVDYDENEITYEELLENFFSCHNPTQVNRQGVDIGTQYRTVIYTFNDAQKEAAKKMKAELDDAGRFKTPIATKIEDAQTFWRAEEYHQQYFVKNDIQFCPSSVG